MLWCFWVAVGLGVLMSFIINMTVGMEAHSKIDCLKKDAEADVRERDKRRRADCADLAQRNAELEDGIRLVNKAVNDLECRLQTIKDLL
jgi:hypothetical protein